jgi:hypothetical protein
MIRHALLLALPLGLALAACDGPGTSIKIDASGGEGNTTVATDSNGQMSIKVPGFEGAIKLPKIQIDAEDFDVNGLKLYPGSKIGELNVDAQEKIGTRDKGQVAIGFESPAPLATVKAWFAENLAKRNFKVVPHDNSFAGTTDDGEIFKLELSDTGEGKTKGRMEVGS